ncbi:hypothetical protein ABI59_09430 [Acidobacteria bacterium Mor1]|nr:hypothetical protein ABI59_09430 [Acidobacteria bacterium Mor1]
MIDALYLVAAVLLVLLNAFFVATEFAIVRVRNTRLDEMVESGVARAGAAREVTRSLDAMLSACQLGITLASLGLGWLGEPAFAHLLEPLFASMGAMSEVAAHSVAVTLAFMIITFLHIVFGELAPKTIAIAYPEKTTLWIAWPIRFFHRVLYPFIWALNGTANWSVRLMGLEPNAEFSRAHSEAELRMVLEQSHQGGHLSESHKGLLVKALDFPNHPARQIMVPRTDIVYIDVTHSIDEIRRTVRRSGHTRYPVCEGDLDKVVGILHIKDLFLADEPDDILKIMREPVFVPESIQVGALLERFQNERRHLCIVLDEYGGTSGIVTIEDVIEELTGEIQDEHDHETPKVRPLSDGRLSVDAAYPTDELEEELGLEGSADDEDVEEVDTLGGLVVTKLGRLARPGDAVELAGRRIEVSRVRGRRIVRLIVHPAVQDETAV